MALNATFYPRGPLYLVGTAAVNCATTDGSGTAATYRIKCIAASRQYITWGNTNAVTAVGAPSVSSAATAGMDANQIELFNAVGPWFIATASASFEVMPGEGQ